MEHTKLAELALAAINEATIPATQAENVAAAKHWLNAIRTGKLVVSDDSDPPGMQSPEGEDGVQG